jgi:hypothetical protein
MVVLIFSGPPDVKYRIIILEHQHVENWISQVISEDFVCRFVGDNTTFLPEPLTTIYGMPT